ncbi:MAG: PspA/IM30 family protein [Streptosporangiaceae bacterium]|jgi:DNA-binding XRE family transcriptional regulator
MSYRLQMHTKIHDWLTGLRVTEPHVARLVGEAVLAMLEAGESLGPPLVVPLETALRPPADPGEALDYSYQRQLEALTKVRRSVADVATSRKRVELQVAQLENGAERLAGQQARALEIGREDLAREAGTREAAIREQVADLARQLGVLIGEEERITIASQRLQAKVDSFRIRKETIKATHVAEEATRRVRRAFTSLGDDTIELDMTGADPGFSEDAHSAPAAADLVLEEISELHLTLNGPGPADDQEVPPGLMELRPGVPDSMPVGLLFVVEPPDMAVLVAWVEEPGGLPDRYQEVIGLAAARLAQVPPGSPLAVAASPGAFLSYDAESFLDEFFPGEETEVEIGAAALIARHRAYTLAQARQRLGLTQVQVAGRMRVRQERVSAIERADPGATEIRTLAAYVAALGGRLEIVADIGGERITLV